MKTNDYRLNMNVELPAVLRVEEQLWVTSPADGVSRLPLEREARESGHTTSFVKFEPGSHFPEHAHHREKKYMYWTGCFPMKMATIQQALIFVTLQALSTPHSQSRVAHYL